MIGGALCPTIVELSRTLNINDLVIIGMFGVIGTVFGFFLKETKDKELGDEIEELTYRYSVRMSLK